MDFLVGSAIFRDELLVSETVNLWKMNPYSFILANLFEVAQKRAVFGEFCFEAVMSNSRTSWQYALSTSAKGVVYPMYSCLSNVFFTVANTTYQGEQFVLLQCER